MSRWIEPVTLKGQHVSLEPLTLDHEQAIAAAAADILRPPRARPLAGKRVLITAGPTHEPIDPVRYIANRSSGKQGHAIAAAAAAAGAQVTLICGPVTIPDPSGVKIVRVETAREMLAAVERALDGSRFEGRGRVAACAGMSFTVWPSSRSSRAQ